MLWAFLFLCQWNLSFSVLFEGNLLVPMALFRCRFGLFMRVLNSSRVLALVAEVFANFVNDHIFLSAIFNLT